jgi:hypothetical protein
VRLVIAALRERGWQSAGSSKEVAKDCNGITYVKTPVVVCVRGFLTLCNMFPARIAAGAEKVAQYTHSVGDIHPSVDVAITTPKRDSSARGNRYARDVGGHIVEIEIHINTACVREIRSQSDFDDVAENLGIAVLERRLN